MDGFAIRTDPRDPARTCFRLLGGDGHGTLPPAAARPIATGARLPRGGTAVIRWEACTVAAREVRVRHPVAPGTDVHAPGTSVRQGQLLARAGSLLSSRVALAAAAAHVDRLAVRAVSVAVFSTGAELRALARPGHRTPDTIGPWIAHQIDRWGAAELGGILPDSTPRIASAIESAARRHDLVITVGGSSLGPHDLTKPGVARVGSLAFGGVNVNVLKRTGVATVRGTPVLILPGQPLSALVGFHEFGLALLERLTGARLRRFDRARLARSHRVAHRMTSTYVAHLRNGVAELLPWGAHSLAAVGSADGFAYLEHGRTYRAGETVRFQRLLP